MSHFQQEVLQTQESKSAKKQKSISLKIEYLKIKISDVEQVIEDLDDDLACSHEKFISARSTMKPLGLQIEEEKDAKKREELYKQHLQLAKLAQHMEQVILQIEEKIRIEKGVLENLNCTKKDLIRQRRQIIVGQRYGSHSDL